MGRGGEEGRGGGQGRLTRMVINALHTTKSVKAYFVVNIQQYFN